MVLCALRYVYDVQVQKTVENILDDIKAKYEAAQDQLGGAQASASQALSDLDMIKLVQQQKLDELKQLCRYALHPLVREQLPESAADGNVLEQ